MFHFKTVLLMALLTVSFSGCGSGGHGVKKGDKLVVIEDLSRERIEVEYADGTTDGFTREIPKGTILQVVLTPKIGSPIFEVVPVKVGEITDAEEVQGFFIPERYSNKEGLIAYSIAIKHEYIGIKVKKTE